MSENENIDYHRWYRELYKKFTTVRDMIETYRCNIGLIDDMETALYHVCYHKFESHGMFEIASKLINETLQQVSDEINKKLFFLK
jgi:hypothetical protein